MLEALQDVSLAEVESVAEENGQAAESASQEMPSSSVESAPAPSGLQQLDAYEERYRVKVDPLYEFVIHGLLNGNDAQAQVMLRFVNTLLTEMEWLAVTDWLKRKSKRAKVRVTLKRLMRLAQIDGFS